MCHAEYDEDDEGEEDDDDDYLIGFDPFAGDIMDYALFMRM